MISLQGTSYCTDLALFSLCSSLFLKDLSPNKQHHSYTWTVSDMRANLHSMLQYQIKPVDKDGIIYGDKKTAFFI